MLCLRATGCAMICPPTRNGGLDGPVRRKQRLNPYRPATDTGLLAIFAVVAAIILIVISGAFDCRFQFIHVGFC